MFQFRTMTKRSPGRAIASLILALAFPSLLFPVKVALGDFPGSKLSLVSSEELDLRPTTKVSKQVLSLRNQKLCNSPSCLRRAHYFEPGHKDIRCNTQLCVCGVGMLEGEAGADGAGTGQVLLRAQRNKLPR